MGRRSNLPATLYPDNWLSGPRDSYILQCSPKDEGRIEWPPQLDRSAQIFGRMLDPALLHDCALDHQIISPEHKVQSWAVATPRTRDSALARFSQPRKA